MDINALNVLAERIKEHTCQLLQLGGPFGFKPRGTGVLIEVQGNSYLLTASHVIDENERLYISLKEGVLRIAGHGLFSNLSHDKYIDKACIKLDEDSAKILRENYFFIPEGGINFKHINNYNDSYAIYGYPESSTKKKDGIVIAGGEFWEMKPSKHKVYNHYKIDNSKCIILDKSGRITSSETGKKERRKPALHGLSGGGIWAISAHGDKPVTLNYTLVGIMTEYKNDRYNIIIGNNISLFSELIDALSNPK